MKPDTILAEPMDIEEGDILTDHLGQRVKFPMRSDGTLWFVFDAHRPYPRLITVLPLDAEVEVLRAPKDVSEESAVGNDAVSDRAADPPSSDTQNSSTGDLPGCQPTISREGTGGSVRPGGPLTAIPATDDDWSTPAGMTWEQRADRPSWHPDDCQLDCCWRRRAIDTDQIPRISDDTPPRGISRPFYLVPNSIEADVDSDYGWKQGRR